MVTVFTPTYNRAYILPQLYQSLCKQSCSDFEWLIVDDGSNDNTRQLVSQWIDQGVINIRYYRQQNGGKHRAINKGIELAKGFWFVIVDSDDHLTSDAVEWIRNTGEQIRNDAAFCGLSAIRISPDGNKIGGGDDFGSIDANAIDIRLKHNIKGDMAEVFKTDVLRQFKFPEFDGEKFCPEALVWFRLARKYKMRFVHKGIYVCEYLPDGLTARITRLRHQAVTASNIYYSEHFHDNISIKWKIKAAVNFWRFFNGSYKSEYDMLSLLSLSCWLPGKLMRFRDRKYLK